MTTEWSVWSAVFVRLGVGVILFVHGIGKVFGIGPAATSVPTFAETLAGLGIPVPMVAAWVVALVEAVGGACLLLGLLTQIAAVLIAIDMAVASILVHAPKGFLVSNSGVEFTLILCLASLSLLFSGPGPISIDRTVFNRDHVLARRT